jgi:hypothetical protein
MITNLTASCKFAIFMLRGGEDPCVCFGRTTLWEAAHGEPIAKPATRSVFVSQKGGSKGESTNR